MGRPNIDSFRSSNVDGVKLIQVIEVNSIFGDGTNEEGHSPIRSITEYYSLDGKLLATVDTWKAEQGKQS